MLGTVCNSVSWVMTVALSSVACWFAGILCFGRGISIVGWSLYSREASLENMPLIYCKELSKCNKAILETLNGILICIPGSIHVSFQLVLIPWSKVKVAIFISDCPYIFEVEDTPCACVVMKQKDEGMLMKYVTSTDSPLVTMSFKQTITGKNQLLPWLVTLHEVLQQLLQVF